MTIRDSFLRECHRFILRKVAYGVIMLMIFMISLVMAAQFAVSSPPDAPEISREKAIGRGPEASGTLPTAVMESNACRLPAWYVPIVAIEKTDNTIQGLVETVSISIADFEHEMGGFDFLIAYDGAALTFVGCSPGQWFVDCDWEYFSYYHNPNINCIHDCPSDLLRVVAMADINNGAHHPSCYGPPYTSPHELTELSFRVTEDRDFECRFVPIQFFWNDCGDNIIVNAACDTIIVSDRIFESDGTEITNPACGFPTYSGFQEECFEDSSFNRLPLIQLIEFVNGGIDIICAEPINEHGDINLNGVSYEIADAFIFNNYFLYGLAAFTIDLERQIAATEINGDGDPLTVGDLTYLIRAVSYTHLTLPTN